MPQTDVPEYVVECMRMSGFCPDHDHQSVKNVVHADSVFYASTLYDGCFGGKWVGNNIISHNSTHGNYLPGKKFIEYD